MSEGPVRHCPGCGQALRFPEGIGGMLMACPDCGHRFASPFKLAGAACAPKVSNATVPPAPLQAPPETPPASPPTLKALPQKSHAARVAALYASKA